MSSKVVKRLLTATLVVVLTAAPAIGALATTVPSDSAATETVSSSTGGTVTSLAAVPTTSEVTIDGKVVKSTISGVYLATNLNGTVITTDAASLTAGYGLVSGERLHARFSNTDTEKSYMAMASLEGAAAALGATAGPVFNFELGKLASGKFSTLSAEGPTFRVSIGLPKNFVEAGYTYAVVCVRAGGAITVLPNISATEGTLTFDTTGGLGAYMVVKIKA